MEVDAAKAELRAAFLVGPILELPANMFVNKHELIGP